MYIVKQAILCANGEVFIIANHHWSTYAHRCLGLSNGIYGFVDETGKFYDKYEAKKIALESGQIEDTEYDALYAEDLWPELITIGI